MAQDMHLQAMNPRPKKTLVENKVMAPESALLRLLRGGQVTVSSVLGFCESSWGKERPPVERMQVAVVC